MRQRPPAYPRNAARLLLGLVMAGGLWAAAPASAQVEPVITYNYYPVTPEVGRSLYRQLYTDTPLSHEGQKAAGLTRSPIRTHYEISSTTIGLCRVRNLEVTCHCEITLPRLQSSDPGLKSDFDSYLALLKDHELTHCRISAGFAGRLKDAVLALGERPCGAFKSEIETIVKRMTAELNREQERFDYNTRLGGYQARKAQIMLDRPPPPRSRPPEEAVGNLPEPDQDAFWPGPANGDPETGAIYKDRDGVWRNY